MKKYKMLKTTTGLDLEAMIKSSVQSAASKLDGPDQTPPA